MSHEERIAAAVTLAVVVLLLLLCFFVTFGPDFSVPNPSDNEKPQLAQETDEEEFIDVVLEEKGIEQTDENALEAEALPKGEPEYSEKPEMIKSVSGPSDKPTKSDETLITQNKSAVTTTPASKKDQPDSKISNSMKGKFSPHNGMPDNSAPGASGSGGEGTGVASGYVNGRDFKGCHPAPKVKLHQALTVVVDVVVDENGNVIKATYRSGTSDPAIQAECEKASKNAKWSAAKGSKRTPGTITWRLKPGTK